MDYQNQILLQAIKTQIIHKYITPIINDPKPKPMIRLPFEVYQYDEQNDY